MIPLGNSKPAQRSALELEAAVRSPRNIYQQHFAPFAPRHGFIKREPNVRSILGTGRQTNARADYSGVASSYSSTMGPGLRGGM